MLASRRYVAAMTSPYTLGALMPAPVPPPRRRPAWVVPVAVLVLVIATAGVTWALTRRTATHPAAPIVPAVLSIRGTLQLDAAVGPRWPVGQECWGRDGYQDIRDGAAVTVTDPAGKVLAISQLGAGAVAEHPTIAGAKTCLFEFTVPGVPAGAGIYGIEVSHRGAVRFEEARLGGSVQLTLG